MKPSLRSRHRQIWVILAILLPIGWFASVWSIPAPVRQQPVRPALPPPFARILKTQTTTGFLFNLREDPAGTQKQIEVFILKPLETPGIQLYAKGAPNGHDQLLGALQTRGVYRFNLDSTLTAPVFRLEDPIHNKTVSTVHFE
jgi:hypothetical protein